MNALLRFTFPAQNLCRQFLPRPISLSILPEAGEEWTILTFVEFLAAVPVSIVAPHALDVLGVELAELAAEVPLRHLVRGGGWRWH